MNKWVGFKGVVYNLPDGTVKLESYVDKDNNNHWQKVEELVDSGHWGNDMTHCNANTPGAAITWASPMFDYKSTGVTYDFQKLSLREIESATPIVIVYRRQISKQSTISQNMHESINLFDCQVHRIISLYDLKFPVLFGLQYGN